MKIGPELLADLAVMNLSYNQICDLFGLTEQQRYSPGAGLWIVDCIKQLQTTTLLYKSMQMQKSDSTKVENYQPAAMMPPNPLVDPDKKL